MSQAAFDFDAGERGAEAVERTFGVRELADAINGVLTAGFGDGVWVRGEIQGWSGHRQHAYFSLVEDTPEGKATVDVAFFAGQRARLRPLLERNRLALADGLKVRIFGRLEVYPPTGRLSVRMTNVDPRYTLGEMALERDEIVRRLREAGLYDANRARPLRTPPLRVGLVTSVDSAAWHDATNELARSGLGFRLTVVDVRVQGEAAVPMIARAVSHLGARPDLDVVMVVRGGGSRTDLAAFDAEAVAVAIAGSRLPVFTGIGHETDRSVADEVAHQCFKTPTACAAALVDLTRAYLTGAESAYAAVLERTRRLLDECTLSLGRLAHGVRHRTVAAVERSDQRLGQHADSVRRRAERVLDRHEQRVAAVQAEVGRRALRHTDAAERELEHLAAKVQLLDPARTLARGWSITRGPDGRAVRDAATLSIGDHLTTTFASGSVNSRVEEAPHTP